MEANQSNSTNNLKNRILNKIQSDEVSMHSGRYFVLKTAGVVAVAVLVMLITIFICNYIVFSARINHHLELLGAGRTGLALFMQMFPWSFLFFDIALLIFLRQLLKEFRFGYQLPAFYIFLGIVVLAVAASLFLDDGVHVNDRLFEHAERHELPGILNELYEHAPRPTPTNIRMIMMPYPQNN